MIKKIDFILLFCGLISSCMQPYNSAAVYDSESTAAWGENTINRALTKLGQTPTGRKTLSQIETIKSNGYQINFRFLTIDQMKNLNGHSGGAYQRDNSLYTVFISKIESSLDPENETAHVLAHELGHIMDEVEMNNVTRNYPTLAAQTTSFINASRQQSSFSIHQYENGLVQYVLGTLFCTEARSYSINQKLASEGIGTEYFYHNDSNLSQFIDANYIQKFNTSYGSDALTVLSWCKSFNSMTDIQMSLISK